MKITVAEVLMGDRLVSWGRCLMVVMIRLRLIACHRWLEMLSWVPVGQIDSFLVLAMWHVILFLNQGVGP